MEFQIGSCLKIIKNTIETHPFTHIHAKQKRLTPAEAIKKRPVSIQHGTFYATAKTRKFNSLHERTAEKLEFRPILSQVGTYT